MNEQLQLEVDEPRPNPNAHFFGPDGKTPKRMMWCGDTPRLGGPCPYGGRFPAKPNCYDPYDGACCKDIACGK